MFSWSSSAKLKVVGAEGHTADSLRNEVNRGAKFVIYSYNFSLVVMSFKRPSNIHFIRPGESRVVKGLPYTLISLLFGWWGIPWGVIYTFQSLTQNLTGGNDVTAEMLAALAPPPAPEGAAAPAGTSPPPPVPRPASPAMSGRRILTGLAVLAAVAAVVYPSICFFCGQSLRVALVSGLPKGYDITLNGTRYHLHRGAPEVLKMAEGTFTWRAEFPGGVREEQTFTLATDFFSRPFSPRVAVLNPDRTAVVYEETTFYHPRGRNSTPEEPRYTLHVGAARYLLPEPDYVFTDFPASLEMPSGSDSMAKTRLGAIDRLNAEQIVNLVREKLDYAHARAFIENFARFLPEDESLLGTASSTLQPPDALKFYQTRLAQRPVLVEWHRYYQNYAEYFAPQIDLTAQYRALMAAEPKDGALCYLFARLDPDGTVTRPLYERALASQPPCYHACNAIGFDELSAAHFESALEYFTQAESHGLHSEALRRSRRAALLGLHRYEPLLHDARARCQASPDDTEAAADEIRLTLLAGGDLKAAAKLKATFLQHLDSQKVGSADHDLADHYLSSTIAYGQAQTADYIRHLAQMPAKQGNWALEISRGNLAAAEKALAAYPRVSMQAWLLTYIAALGSGDQAAANRYFAKATDAMATEGKANKRIAASLAGKTVLTPEAICALPMYPDEKRVLLAALGLRQPENRETYFRTARLMNLEPDFPYLLLKDTLKE